MEMVEMTRDGSSIDGETTDLEDLSIESCETLEDNNNDDSLLFGHTIMLSQGSSYQNLKP